MHYARNETALNATALDSTRILLHAVYMSKEDDEHTGIHSPFTQRRFVIADRTIQAEVRAMIGRIGEIQTARRLGVHRFLPARLLAGLPISPEALERVTAFVEKRGAA